MSTAEREFVIRESFKDVIESNGMKYGDECRHYSVDWIPYLSKIDEDIILGLYSVPGDAENEYSVSAQLEIRVTSGGKSILVAQKEHTFGSDEEGVLHIAQQNEIEENLINDSFTVQYYVKILETSGVRGAKSKYDESKKKYSDIVLIVDGEKFYVSKGYLASRSKYFESLFMGNFKESTQSEIVLNGIEVEDFQNYLDVLYHETTVNDQTVKKLLHLADMYETECVLKQAEQFLLEKSKKSMKEKLELATKYNFEDLKKKFLAEIETIDDIHYALSNDITQMDSVVVAQLLKKALDLHVN